MTDSGNRFRVYGPALALALAALILYLLGITWGLPSATDPRRIWLWGSDELAPIGALAQVFTSCCVAIPPSIRVIRCCRI
jgi:hypothetical protein